MIPFTQYLLPDGDKREIAIERPADIEERATAVINRNARFEAEVLTTGEISLTVHYKEEDIAIEICSNGPSVPEAVDRLVKTAHSLLFPETKQ